LLLFCQQVSVPRTIVKCQCGNCAKQWKEINEKTAEVWWWAITKRAASRTKMLTNSNKQKKKKKKIITNKRWKTKLSSANCPSSEGLNERWIVIAISPTSASLESPTLQRRKFSFVREIKHSLWMHLLFVLKTPAICGSYSSPVFPPAPQPPPFCYSCFYQFCSVSLLLIEKKLRRHNGIKLLDVIYFADAVAHFNYI